MLRTPAPEETQNQTDNSHSFSLKWNLAYVIISDPTLQRKRCPRSQKGGEGAEMKPNPSKKGRLPRGWGTWRWQTRDLLDFSVPCFLSRGDNGRDSGESPWGRPQSSTKKSSPAAVHFHQVWLKHRWPGSGFEQKSVDQTPSMAHCPQGSEQIFKWPLKWQVLNRVCGTLALTNSSGSKHYSLVPTPKWSPPSPSLIWLPGT